MVLFWSFLIVFVVSVFRFGRFTCFGGFVSLVSMVSFRLFRGFRFARFGRFVSLFRVLVHASFLWLSRLNDRERVTANLPIMS